MTDDSNISISINGVSHPVLCGTCKTPIAFVGEANTDTRDAGCVGCDNVTNIKEVADTAIEYAKDEGQLTLNRIARDAARKSKFMTFIGKTTHDKAYRFVVDLKL